VFGFIIKHPFDDASWKVVYNTKPMSNQKFWVATSEPTINQIKITKLERRFVKNVKLTDF
jgi:hypothetical protein